MDSLNLHGIFMTWEWYAGDKFASYCFTTSKQIHKGLKFVYDIAQNLSPKTYDHDIYMQYLNFHI